MSNVWHQHRAHIAGIWELVSFEIWDCQGPHRKVISRPNTDKPLGRSVITPGGFSSVHNVRPDVMQRFKDVPLSKASVEQLADILRGISMYCGPVQLFEDGNDGLLLEILVASASDPQRIGGIQKRKLIYFQEDSSDFMLLKPKDEYLLQDGTRAYPELKWRRFEEFTI
ncbi:hypothetical protein EDB81DRAFT_874948 [Dactylonectria macrodidyma]|uniref:Lipocalin-like domain-containing protein n=1 Tax=Dactylonectria macrodidyma TaxID=307937 RepID=A0A9P9JMX2_9HYPO|nr:hypothetical protein EDB81DRAFT_874948 [Dactylonectria macrodidyma]